jgi:hypothetical protein
MGTSASNKGGTGGGWTEFKRNSAYFARYGGRERAAKALAGYVAAMGGAAAAAAAAAAGTRTGQSLGTFLAGSTGAEGLAGGLEAVGLDHLVGQDRFTVLSELLTVFAGTGSDLEDQAARDALLDVLDELLPQGDDLQLESVRLDEAAVTDALSRYIELLVYNRAIPVIDVRLEQLQNQSLIQQRDRELRDFIHALVRLKMQEVSPLTIDWQGAEGKEFVEGILGALYEQLEEWR